MLINEFDSAKDRYNEVDFVAGWGTSTFAACDEGACLDDFFLPLGINELLAKVGSEVHSFFAFVVVFICEA